MPFTRATYDGEELPVNFSYKPYVPAKRLGVLPTATAVVIQSASPAQIVVGEDIITWQVRAAFPTEFKQFWDWYNTALLTGSEVTFTGYWGEELKVIFAKFEPPSVKGRLFDLSGAFQVTEIVGQYDPTCSPSLA
jgi:hypothetical protein